MGSWISKKTRKEPDALFVREKKKEERRKKKQKKVLDPNLKRKGLRMPVVDAREPVSSGPLSSPAPAPAVAAGAQRSYDEEALERMRHQLDHDADAFLLNNILLSVQFFENYESSAVGRDRVRQLTATRRARPERLGPERPIRYRKAI